MVSELLGCAVSGSPTMDFRGGLPMDVTDCRPTNYTVSGGFLYADGNYPQILELQSTLLDINSSSQSDAYMHQYTRPTCVKKMACRLFGAKSSSEHVFK